MTDFDNTNKGVAFINDKKESDKHPAHKGKGNFNGVDFEFSIWENTSKEGKAYMSFSFQEPFVPVVQDAPMTPAVPVAPIGDDEIPF